MPKHEGPIKHLIDPFSIPAQMNNLGVFIVAYVTQNIYKGESCVDLENLPYLNFIYYGSAIVCGGTALLSILYMIGLLDYCINKVMPCGEVCLTLNTLTIFLAGLMYHFIATIYGLYKLIWGESSPCVEIEMFKQITCGIYFCWFSFIVIFLVVKGVVACKKKEIPSVEETYTELK